MPSLRPCQHGCPILVRSGHCAAHGGPASAWKAKLETTPRLRGTANQARRRRLFQREPLCRECAKEGRTTFAVIRDHVIPLADGGAEGTDENEQPLCADCSAKKTAAEAQRGIKRDW